MTIANNKDMGPLRVAVGRERATASPERRKTAGQMAAFLRALEATNRTAVAVAVAGPTAGAPASAANARMFDKTLRGYEDAGRWKPALGLLNRLISGSSSGGVRPDLRTYGIVVSTCAKAGHWREASNLVLREMPARGVSPDAATYGAVLDACGKRGRWKEVLALMEGMFRAGLTPTVGMYNNAITLCGGGGRAQVAVDLLDQMEAAPGLTPNVASVNSVMTACQQAGEWERTLELLRRLEASPEVKPNVRSFNVAIKALGDSGDCDAALALFREMLAAGIAANVDSYSSVAGAFEKAGRIDDGSVLGLLGEMSDSLAVSASADPADTITIGGSVLNANPLPSAGGTHASKKWRQAVGLLREVEGSAVRRATGTLAGSGRSASGRVTAGETQGGLKALSLLKGMSGTEIPETPGSFSLAITKRGHEGKWEEAVELLRAMGNVGVPPSRKCYHGAIAACGNSKRYEEALELLREMPKAGFPLSDKSYRCAISACGNAGRFEECVSLLREARAAGLPPSSGSYSLAIMACGDAGRLQPALSLLKEAEALDIVSNGACYNAAAKACKDCGQPEEAAAVLERLEKHTTTSQRNK